MGGTAVGGTAVGGTAVGGTGVGVLVGVGVAEGGNGQSPAPALHQLQDLQALTQTAEEQDVNVNVPSEHL